MTHTKTVITAKTTTTWNADDRTGDPTRAGSSAIDAAGPDRILELWPEGRRTARGR